MSEIVSEMIAESQTSHHCCTSRRTEQAVQQSVLPVQNSASPMSTFLRSMYVRESIYLPFYLYLSTYLLLLKMIDQVNDDDDDDDDEKKKKEDKVAEHVQILADKQIYIHTYEYL